MALKSIKSGFDKYSYNKMIKNAWTQQHSHNDITSSGPFGAGKYEGLPNFIGGLYVEDGILKLMKEDNQTVELGKASDIESNKNLFSSILDKYFE